MTGRWNVRIPARISVDLQPADSDCICGETRNISFDGMFVQAPGWSLQQGTPVQVGIDTGLGRLHIQAVAVRCVAEGIGLMFTDPSEEAAVALALIMEQNLPRREQSHPINA
ncbi:MAG: PilZ domain-containing protein [Gammaproteobacteria bacterium]